MRDTGVNGTDDVQPEIEVTAPCTEAHECLDGLYLILARLNRSERDETNLSIRQLLRLTHTGHPSDLRGKRHRFDGRQPTWLVAVLCPPALNILCSVCRDRQQEVYSRQRTNVVPVFCGHRLVSDLPQRD